MSVSSVSRVLNGGLYTSPELHARILRAVKKLQFVPDTAAQAMRSRTTKTIGCMVPDISNPLYAEIINGAETELQSRGYVLMFGSTQHEEVRELAIISALRRRRMDGILLTAGEDRPETVGAALLGLDLPCVGVDRIVPNASVVRADHRGGAVEATRYLIGLGHRRIALLMGSASMLPGAERLAGYRKALSDAGLPYDPRLMRPQRLATSFAFSEVCQLLALEDRPTAIITLGTHMLAGVLEALSSVGLAAPRDMSLVSVGDTDLARLAKPSITAVAWDLKELGQQAARILVDQINAGADFEPKTMLLPTHLVLRQSCAAPPSRSSAPSRADRAKPSKLRRG